MASTKKKLGFDGDRGMFEGFMDDYESTGVMKNWDHQMTTTMLEDMPEIGYAADLDAMEKKEKKCLMKKHKKTMCELMLAVASNIISPIIEETNVDKLFPFGRL